MVNLHPDNYSKNFEEYKIPNLMDKVVELMI